MQEAACGPLRRAQTPTDTSGAPQFGTWLTKWFTVVVIAWAVLNYFAPATSMWAKSYTGYFLSVVLFGMGMTLSLDDFKRILTMPLMVVVGTVAHYVIMPLLAVFLCWVFPSQLL